MADQNTWERAKEIFSEAVEIESPQGRASLIEQRCGDDEALCEQVKTLLRAQDDAGSFMNAPSAGAASHDATSISTVTEKPGELIGRYKLLEQIGEGGFGTVWAAEQREPVRRRVALKIIKLGMDTKQVIARFEAERQALAMMDHPNIAKVLDAGSTESGRPYFVMELVKGVPILDYCDTEKLGTKARLALFMKVCHAIQHAHQKGIIHRDIKPSNVLVTLHDGVPVPKVIDFGIAKATNTELTNKTIYTQHRQMIGTPAYMSPEQAEMSGLDIDTRSDVYSLGVLLYELLTGTTPFENESLMQAGFAEMMRIIREETPHKPSTRLSSLGETGTRTALQRQTDVKHLNLALRGDLDWIVMKCLEKDRARRYETANGLAADIQRHMNDEPVNAGPPSASYKLSKFIKRNRGQVIAGGAIAALLVLGVVGTSMGMLWALDEKSRADIEATNASLAAASEKQAKLDAQANERKAIEEAERAERELARATEIKRLITEMLQSVDPAEARGADITLLKGILDDAAARLTCGEITDELIAAELHGVVGSVYRRLGLYPAADEHMPAALDIRTRLLGREDPVTLWSMGDLADLYRDQGRYAEAESLYLERLEITKRVLGAEHPSTLGTMNNLSGLYHAQGRYAEAERLMLETLEIKRRVLGAEHPSVQASISNLATLYTFQGRYAEAEPLFLETLEVHKRSLGAEHPTTLGAVSILARLYQDQGRYAEAEPLYLEMLEIHKRVLGAEHPSTLGFMGSLATLYGDQGRNAEAEPLYLETLEILKRTLTAEHPTTLGTMTNLGTLYITMERYEDAAAMFEISLPIKRRVLGLQHPWTGYAMRGLAAAYKSLGRQDESLLLQREFLELEITAADAPGATAHTLYSAAQGLLNYDLEGLPDPERALGYARRACAIADAAGDPDLWAFLDTLALAQHMSGDTATAIETQKRAIEIAPEAQREELKATLAKYEAALAEQSEDDGG